MTVWFTSDLHLGHRKVAEIRGFDNVEDHDKAVLDSIRSRVKREGVVWVLGDLAVSSPTDALTALSNLVDECNIILRLIWGNHDAGHPMHRDAATRAWRYEKAFESAAQSARRRVAGQEVLLSHFPYEGDTDGRAEDRHVQWRLRDMGVPIIHGHTHSARRYGVSSQGTPQLHVGWDAWRRPVSLEEVAIGLA